MSILINTFVMYHWKGSKKWKGLLKYPPTIWILNCRFVVLFFVVSVVLPCIRKRWIWRLHQQLIWSRMGTFIPINIDLPLVLLCGFVNLMLLTNTIWNYLFQCAQRLTKRQQLSTQEYWKLQYCTTYMIVIYYEYLFNDKHNIIIIKNNTAFLISIDYRVLITGLYIV